MPRGERVSRPGQPGQWISVAPAQECDKLEGRRGEPWEQAAQKGDGGVRLYLWVSLRRRANSGAAPTPRSRPHATLSPEFSGALNPG